MDKQKIIFILFLLSSILFVAPFAFAGIGVGINLGKIEINEPLKPGGIYNLPLIGVINTGDEAGDYELEITYHQDQPELRPNKEWFSFSPNTFYLESGKSKNVATKIELPLNTRPGDYFAYIEAHPIVESRPGTSIGIAAATKTYFTVEPANIFSSIIWRIYSLFTIYSPWSYVTLAVVVGAVIIAIFRRFFNFQIGVSKKV